MSAALGSPANFPFPTMTTKQMGGWLPLPHIVSGYCVHPFHPYPSPPNSPTQHGEPGPSSAKSRQRNRFSWSGVAATSGGAGGEGGRGGFGTKANAYEVPLDVGDEFFAFEEYRCGADDGGKGEVWYRGYVIQAVSLLSISPMPRSQPFPPLTSNSAFPHPEPSVLVGIFPASVVQPRPLAGDDLGDPSEAYQLAVRLAEEQSRATAKGYEMGVVQEEDESELSPVQSTLVSPINAGGVESDHLGGEGVVDIPADKKAVGTAPPRPNRPKSLQLLANPTETEGEGDKEQPPLPTLTAGDSTVAGQQWPLIDEISCAIREWYARIPTYLANREYRLFNLVVQHIDALFLGRRQLLSQTLSADELIRVRRECVSRLVKCNVAQGLEVIVRSLEDGSVMVVDKSRAVGHSGYMTGITAYVYQVQLAYIDLIPLDTLFGRLPTHVASRADPRQSLQAVAKPGPTLSGMFYHLLLDFRAFIASPCAPGETAELYFSLFSKTENQFITEEYCLILNHLGSPARDAEQRLGRLRTLFTDLKGDEVNGHGQVYLVCRLIRNGAISTRLEASSSGTRGSESRRPSSVRPTGTYLSPHGHHNDTLRSKVSVSSIITDDSWSITSGFAGHRTNTVETANTTTASIIDGRPSFRRPLGCAVLELPKLNKMLSDGGEKGGMEFSIPIFAPATEEAFATLHEDIIFGRMSHVVTSPRAEAIAVGVRVLQGEVDQLVYEHPSLLAESPISARLGFPDIVSPHQIRNDIYIKLWSASFYPSPSSGGGSIRLRKSIVPANLGNVQISVELRKPDGSLIPGAMFAGGSGEPSISHFHSMVFTQTERPTYGELIKVALPPVVGDAHLFLSFRSRGKDRHLSTDPQELERPFAVAYLPLVGSGGAIEDGSHNLILYRSEKSTLPGPNVYLSSPPTSTSAQDGSGNRGLTPLRDRLTVRTFLASTIHSSDDTLRSLFAWQSMTGDPSALSSTLNTFSFVSETEISKFIPGVLDALFGILTSNVGSSGKRAERTEIDTLVFSSIVKVFSMSTDRRFPNFTAALDIYISEQFNRPASAAQLLASMKAVMSSPNTKAYRLFLKVWHLFFRFIIRSRELDRARGIGLDATSAHIEADFQRQVKSVLSDINSLMSSTDQGLIGTQTLAVQHYADLIPSLAKIFAPVEIAQMIITFADTLTAAKGSMAVYKLLLLLAVVKSVFDSAASRALLIPALVRWVKPHLGRYDEGYAGAEDERARDMKRIKWMECNRLAVTVVAWTINCLQEWLDSEVVQESDELRAQEQDNLEYLLTLLPSLCDSYAELRSSSTTSTLSRHRTEGTIWKETPDIFPISHPFALVSQLPPPSLLEQNQKGDESGLTELSTFNCGLAECAVVVLSLVLATPRHNVDRYLIEMLDIEGKERTSTRLQGVISFCSSVIHFDAFPRQWLSLSLMSFSAIIRLLYPIIDLLQRPEFIPPIKEAEGFDVPLFTTALQLLCDLCGSDELALEDHTQQKRRAGWIIAGDLRDEGSGLLLALWGALGWSDEGGSSGMRHGGYQTRFTGLAERILGLCLSSHDQLCETAVEILYSMIYAEYLLLGKFSTIETEIFAKLDGLFSQKSAGSADPSDSTMRAYFITQLRTLYESKPSPDPTFANQFSTFLDEVELFIDLLLAFRDLPDSVEWKDERAYAIYRLMDFIRRVGRSELYVRFVHQLVGINVAAKDWLGAGLAMKMHGETYEWVGDGDLVDRWAGEGVKLPAQTQFARRESLYYHAIDYFAEAEAYEFALELCQELTTQHMALTYDVNKITELLTHQARLWERMGQSTRPKPEYFRVAYYGECTPVNQGKEFIVRGQPWQRYVDFCESLQVKFPHSTIHRSKIAPSPEAISAGDIIWVTAVHPEPDESHPALRPGVSANIQAYHRTNGVRRFSSQRPFVKDPEVGSVSGHGHGQGQGILTWTEKTTLITADVLPGLLSRSEVVDISYEEISPLTSAINEIKRGTALLSALVSFKPGQKLDVKQLGTALNGAVDSPINGGVKLYRDTFLDSSYIADHPADKTQLDEFKVVYEEYVRMVHGGLQLHGKVCKDIAFHEALKNHFYKAFSDQSDHLPGLSESPPSGSVDVHINGTALDIEATPKSRTSILVKAFQPSPRPSIVSSSSRQSILTSPTPSHSQQLFPPLRLGPSPNPITPVTTLASPRPIDSASVYSTTTPPNGLPSLSSHARSFAGSIGRSSSGVSTPSRRDSVRTEGRRESSITENGAQVFDADQGSVRRGEGGGGGIILDIAPEKERGVLKRLSSIMRRDSDK